MKHVDSVVQSKSLKEVLSLSSNFTDKKSRCDLIVCDIFFISICLYADASVFLKEYGEYAACLLSKKNTYNIEFFFYTFRNPSE